MAEPSAGLQRFYWILGGLAVAGILFVGLQLVRQGGGAATEPVEVAGLDDPATLVELAQGMVLGDPAAPVTIYEFGDYQCPGCAQFALETKPLIETAFISDGRAKFVFYDFPLINSHAHAFLAARASRCAAEQDQYWEYHRKLFEQQGRWSPSASPIGLFVGYAGELGMDEDAFEGCVNSDRHAEVVSAQMQLGIQLNVPVTPTVMVSRGNGNATMLSDRSFPSIEAAVENLLAQGN